MVEMVSVHGNRCGENPVYAVAEAAEMVESETEDAEVGSGGPDDRPPMDFHVAKAFLGTYRAGEPSDRETPAASHVAHLKNEHLFDFCHGAYCQRCCC